MASEPQFPGPCPPGYLPPWLYDQREWWIDEEGRRVPIENLSLPQLLTALNRCDERAVKDWQHELSVLLTFIRQAKELGIEPELQELKRLLWIGAKGWLREKKLFTALSARADQCLTS